MHVAADMTGPIIDHATLLVPTQCQVTVSVAANWALAKFFTNFKLIQDENIPKVFIIIIIIIKIPSITRSLLFVKGSFGGRLKSGICAQQPIYQKKGILTYVCVTEVRHLPCPLHHLCQSPSLPCYLLLDGHDSDRCDPVQDASFCTSHFLSIDSKWTTQ